MNDLVSRLREAAGQMKCGVHRPGHLAAIEEAISELDRFKWVSVDERLPMRWEWCLVVGPDNVYFAFINSEGKWVNEYGTVDVLWWMPIPRVPEREEDSNV